jgi:hypothetical protein
MSNTTNEFKPCARKAGLVVREMAGELLVYDRERNQAHSLNETAALIWKHCDGNSTVAELRSRVEAETGGSVDEQVVWYALRKFTRNSLLEEPLKSLPGSRGFSRRELIQTIGLAASVPLVATIIAPNVFAAASCTQSCTSPLNCTVPGCPNCPNGGPTCSA